MGVGERKTWSDKRGEIMSRPGAGAAYEAARLRFELGAVSAAPQGELSQCCLFAGLTGGGSGVDVTA